MCVGMFHKLGQGKQKTGEADSIMIGYERRSQAQAIMLWNMTIFFP